MVATTVAPVCIWYSMVVLGNLPYATGNTEAGILHAQLCLEFSINDGLSSDKVLRYNCEFVVELGKVLEGVLCLQKARSW